MSDVMKIAEARREDLTNTIAELEDDIARMRQEIDRLDGFLQMGAGLMAGGALEDAATKDDGFEESADDMEEDFEDEEFEASAFDNQRPVSQIRDESDLETKRVLRQIMPSTVPPQSEDPFDRDTAQGF